MATLTNPPALVDLFAETIVEELDFRLEAQNMLDIAGRVRIQRPAGHRGSEASSRTGHAAGAGHGAPPRLRLGQRLRHEGGRDDTAAVLRSSLIAFLEGVLLHGVFHGDLHGGNLLVQADGTVALLDFRDHRVGSTSGSALAFLRLQMGATTNNLVVQVDALRDLGALPADSDVEAVIRDLWVWTGRRSIRPRSPPTRWWPSSAT